MAQITLYRDYPDDPPKLQIYIKNLSTTKDSFFTRDFSQDDIQNVTYEEQVIEGIRIFRISLQTHTGYSIKFQFQQDTQSKEIRKDCILEIQRKNFLARSNFLKSYEDTSYDEENEENITESFQFLAKNKPVESLKRGRS